MEITRNLTNRALFTKALRAWLALGLALIATSALPRVEAQDVHVEADCDGDLLVSWDAPPKAGGYLFIPRDDSGAKVVCSDSEPHCVIKGLNRGQTTSYYLDRVTRDGTVYGDAVYFKGTRRSCPEYIAATPTPKPPVDTCAHLPAHIVVSGFRAFETQCQQVDSAGVGNAGLSAQGVLSAVDVWGNANAEIRVCFRQQGRLKFLDAATAPRAVSDLAAETVDGMTCGWITRAGTVALLPSGQTAVQTIAETGDSPPPPAEKGPSSTTACEVETSGILSLRAGPSLYYSRLLSMPRGVRLVARARTGDWFMVTYEGQLGWAHGGYLAVSPGCDSLGEAGAIILPPMIETPTPEDETTQTDTEMTMSEVDSAEMVIPAGQALSGCWLTAGDILNLRAGPGLDYDIYAEIPNGSRLNATAIAKAWFLVEYAGQGGWVNREYVFRSGNCDAPMAATVAPEVTAIAVPDASPLTDCSLRAVDIINLRQGPSLAYPVIAEIPFQTNMSATGRSGDWFMVDFAGLAGWVNNAYVFRTGACG